jgi:hypothetical protein
MRNKELFTACTSQCVWCKEQWPVVNHRGGIVHTAPYTKDPKLFCWGCQSGTIRKAFNYMDYTGGKRIRWKVPPAETIRKTTPNSIIVRPSTRDFWRNIIEASLSVSSWPEWKRGISLTGKESPKATEEDLKRMRDELLQYDALDYWSRRPCTDNFRFRPGYVLGKGFTGGVFAQPTCNWGIGCTACWEKYEKFYEERSKDWCD